MKQRITGWTSTEELLKSVQLKMAARGLRCRQSQSRRASRAEPGSQQTEPGLQQNLQRRDGSGTHQTLPKSKETLFYQQLGQDRAPAGADPPSRSGRQTD